jgi:hypothetical protein
MTTGHPVNAGCPESGGSFFVQQQVVDAQPRIAFPPVPEIIPAASQLSGMLNEAIRG